ncbi:CHAT domain-containing protein [Lactarius psammicola]|nr:CHAT domain-containing protein [Lactarius psammicola]
MADVLGFIDGVDSFLTFFQQFLATPSLSGPLRLLPVLGLGLARLKRFMLSRQMEDLEKSIFHLTEAILLPPHSWLGNGPLILQALYFLTSALLIRSTRSKQPEDAIYAAKYLRHLRDRPHQAPGSLGHAATTSLVSALAIQVEFEVGSVMQNIVEMEILCRELLPMEMSDVTTVQSITLFAGAVLDKIRPWIPDQPLDQLIECLRAARKHKPDLRMVRLALAQSLGCRHWMTFVNDDYEEAASLLDEIVTSSPSGDSQDKLVAQARQIVTALAMVRSGAHQTPEYLEETLFRARAFPRSSSANESFLVAAASDLEHFAKQRFDYFGSIEGPEALDILPLSGPVPEVFPREGSELLRIAQKSTLLIGLLPGIRNNDITKIDEAIEKGRIVLASPDPRDRHTSLLFELFGFILFQAFKSTNKIEYLNESISIRRQALEPPSLPNWRFETLTGQSVSLLVRSQSFPGHRTQDLGEALELLSHCVNDGYTSIPDRFRVACQWASHARHNGHPSVSLAYESAMLLMQDTLPFAPTLQLQHVNLATSDGSHRMPLDYASYQVDLHQLKEAIGTLERGRALLWSEMRHLRTSVDQLLQVHPQLAHEFAAVNRDLEGITKSIPPSLDLNMGDDAADDVKAVDPFGRLLLKQRRLLKERDNLISQIQALPGFDSFLTSPSFDTLRSAALSGPVIIINHSIWRSDILILLHNTSPSLIPTPHDFYRRAGELKDKLLDARNKFGPDSNDYNQTLAHILAELYDLVGRPVIDRLRQLKIPEQSRVWWCPTSVFCSLPLHAMGPIPSDDGGDERYFLDLYIPSYTPTLSALIPGSDHRDPGSPTSGIPSLLLVAHFDVPSPDVSLSEVCEDVKVVQALTTRLPVKSLISKGATATSVRDGLRDHQFVHFVCHSTLEAGTPFDAGFELHGNERLTLLEIVRSHLPAAEFAFLSACHTAELTDGSSAEEGLHLAAAVVVGTMWAMANEDGSDLAKNFYKSMFPRREQGESVPYYKRSAGAFRDAVKKLRKKRGVTLERWVDFVHYGA